MPRHTKGLFDLQEAVLGDDPSDDRPTEKNDGPALRAALERGGDSHELAQMEMEGDAGLDLDGRDDEAHSHE